MLISLPIYSNPTNKKTVSENCYKCMGNMSNRMRHKNLMTEKEYVTEKKPKIEEVIEIDEFKDFK